jgi:hypothetical protein
LKIDNYILERLRADAGHAIAVAKCEDAIQHTGLRGRLREILIANFLAPWLPPFCKCATGMIIEPSNKLRGPTQEDILVIDSSIAPPILASATGPDGVFPLNSVLVRIEVKSTLDRKGISDFIDASLGVVNMGFSKQPGCKNNFAHPVSILVAFKSDSSNDEWDWEFQRFLDVMKERKCPLVLSGFVSAICVVDKGLWLLKDFGGMERAWCRLDSDVKEDNLAWLIAQISNQAYKAHVERQGRDPSQGLEVGIGGFISSPPKIFQLHISEDLQLKPTNTTA